MSTVQPTDTVLIQRGNDLYSSPADMSTAQDTDLLLINRDGVDYSCTVADIRAMNPVLPELVVTYLVIGGGGGGGAAAASTGGGGGGAGGYLTGVLNDLVAGTSYPVTVGAGGSAKSNGSNSVFHLYTAIGGGRGGTYSTGERAADGGSGGGGNGSNIGDNLAGYGTPSQGFEGGAGLGGSSFSGGGGGGAGGRGAVSNSVTAGDGGLGAASDITGFPVTRAGGGGGGGGSGLPAGSSTGGGGNASSPALANTGGGGVGNGGNGGSGVVILRYPLGYTITSPGGGLTYDTTTLETAKVTVFTGGTGTFSFS
jgi:hypothetical protein